MAFSCQDGPKLIQAAQVTSAKKADFWVKNIDFWVKRGFAPSPRR